MNAKKIVISIFKSCITIVVLMFVAMFVYKLCIKTYDFGYRIFAEEPMSPPPGYTTSVAIVEGKSVMEIGEILEERGLIRNAYIFYLQELVSDYHGQLMPGVYELSTAMTPEEMMALMAANYSEDAEESDGDSYDGTSDEYSDYTSDYYEGMPTDGEMQEEIDYQGEEGDDASSGDNIDASSDLNGDSL